MFLRGGKTLCAKIVLAEESTFSHVQTG